MICSERMPNPLSPIRLVLSDIDGTLLDDHGELPDLNRQALAHCKKLGIHTCLATGRRWTTCSRLLDRLGLGTLVDYCILNNGMIVRKLATNESLYSRVFPIELVLEAVARLNGLGLDPIVLGHNHDGRSKDVFHRRDCLMNGDFIAKNPEHERKVSDWRELSGAHLVELVLIGKRGDLQAAAAGLAGLDLETVLLRNSFYKEYMLEITPKGVSKLLGARELLAHLGLGIHEAMAVGDSDNDFELLKNTPLSVAVANAEDKVKAVASEITGANTEGGFGQAVFRHIPRRDGRGSSNLQNT